MPMVKPRCRHSQHSMAEKEPFLSAEGLLWPCCWTSGKWELPITEKFLGDRLSQLDTRLHSHDSIINSDAMRMIADSWEQGTYPVCVQFCPADKADPHRETRRDLPSNNHPILRL